MMRQSTTTVPVLKAEQGSGSGRLKRPRSSSLTLDESLRFAQLLESRSKLPEALAIYDKVLAEEPMNETALIHKALCLTSLGRKADSLALVERALQTNSNNVQAMLMLASALRDTNKMHESIQLLKKVVSMEPENESARLYLSQILNDVGTHLKLHGKIQEGIALYLEAIATLPTHAPSYYNLGVAYGELRDFQTALQYYNKALEVSPGYAEAHCNMGVIHKGLGQLEAAISAYERALACSPAMPFASNNLAIALADLGTEKKTHGENKEALRLYKRALHYNPRYANAHYNLGVAYADMGKVERAVTCYKMALEFDPHQAMALNNLGVIAKSAGQLDKAIDYYERAVAASPTFTQTLNNLGVVYTMLGQIDDAMRVLKRAFQCDSKFVEVSNNLGILYRDECAINESIACYRHCISLDPLTRNAGHNLLLALNYVIEFDAEKVYHEHADWGTRFSSQFTPYTDWPLIKPDRRRPVTIGYISPDYFTHSVSYFIEAPLKFFNKNDFRVICYANVERGDRKTKKFQSYPSIWRNVFGMDTKAVCEMIRDDQVDILVEITGHTAGNRLDVMANKPAPVQVTWIGYPNSSGLKTIDYRFADALCDPVDTKQRYVEHLYRLPKCFLCYTPSDDTGETVPLPVLTNGFITFGSFNNLAKINEDVVALWAAILRHDPQWRLFIKAKSFATPRICQKFYNLFAQHGIASHRIDLVGLLPNTRDHLQAYSYMDISLDTFPYAGTTTTCEALYMGVPVITLKGDNHAQNVGVSLLSQIEGHDRFIANNKDEYVKIAIDLARNLPLLEEVRSTLRERMLSSYLCDGPAFTKNVEAVYREIWTKWCDQQGDTDSEPSDEGTRQM